MESIDMNEVVNDNLVASKQASKQASRNYTLDLMKIIACVAVVGLHTLHKDLSIINSTLYYCCGFAVPVFFMCSGYMLFQRDRVSCSYVVKKIASISRVVLMWSFLIFVCEIGWDILRGRFVMASLLDFPIIAIKSLLQKGRLWQFWYLGALMILYALLPLLFKMKDKMKYIWAICLAVGFVLQAASYIYGQPIQKYFIQTFRLWTWVQYFTLGGLLTQNETFREKISAHQHGVALIVLTAIIVAYQNFMGRFALHNLYAEYFYDDILTVAWVVALFTLVMRLELNDRAVTVIKQLAPITMGVYIVHPLIIMAANKMLLIETIPASLLYFAGILVLSMMACFIMKHVPRIRKLIEI